jgi:DNA helicase-2/ATP-dependent DNA helicase PcrA
VVLNPADEVSWYRLLTRHRAIGKASARGLARILADGGVDRAADAVAAAPAKGRTGLASTLSLLGAVDSTTVVPELVEACRGAVDPLLRAYYPDWQRRVTEVDGIAQAAARQSDLRTFVSEQAIDPVNVAGDWAKQPHLDEDWLTLSTIHSAKGLEWDAVHLMRANDGAMPSDMALTSSAGLAEEERLFYVALTRARDTLDVYVPSQLPTHPTAFLAKHVAAKPSRFLTEPARALMESVSTATVAPEPASNRAVAGPRVRMDAFDELFA